MKQQYGMRLGVTVVAAVALTGGGAAAAHAADGPGKKHQHHNRSIVVRGNHNQVILGNENVLGRDDVTSSGHSDTQNTGGDTGVGTPAQPYGTVISPTGVVLRAAPTTASSSLGTLAHDAKVGLDCKVHGQNVDGNDLWYKLRDQTAWVTARYVVNTGTVPFCPADSGAAPGRTAAQHTATGTAAQHTATGTAAQQAPPAAARFGSRPRPGVPPCSTPRRAPPFSSSSRPAEPPRPVPPRSRPPSGSRPFRQQAPVRRQTPAQAAVGRPLG